MQTTLFRNGGSQAMRIPAQFRFNGDTVDVEWDESLNAMIVRELSAGPLDQFFADIQAAVPLAGGNAYPVDRDGRFDVVAYFEND